MNKALLFVLVMSWLGSITAQNGGLMLKDANAAVVFGPQGDVNLYRQGGGLLKTDTSFSVGGVLLARNVTVLGVDLLAKVNAMSATITQQATTIATLQSQLLGVLTNFITTPTTVFVGPGMQFATIQNAITWASTKVLSARLSIQVVDGVYNLASSIIIQNMPTPHLLSIIGNTANPSRCKIVWPTCSGTWFVIFGPGVSGITFAGFELIGNPACDGLGTFNPGVVVYATNLNVTGFNYGLFADAGSQLAVIGTTITNCGTGVLIEHNSLVMFFGGMSSISLSWSYAVEIFGGQVYVAGPVAISHTPVGVHCNSGWNYAFFYSQINWGQSVAAQTDCPASQLD